MIATLERYFQISRRGSTIGREVRGGVVTFFTMAYIIVLNPLILGFALSAVVGAWGMFECFQTKLPHYLLPVFPPLAFLTADAIVRCLRGEHEDLTTRGTIFAIGASAKRFVSIRALIAPP